jgi:hypothetical protein
MVAIKSSMSMLALLKSGAVIEFSDGFRLLIPCRSIPALLKSGAVIEFSDGAIKIGVGYDVMGNKVFCIWRYIGGDEWEWISDYEMSKVGLDAALDYVNLPF